jgi:hypothetical protein
MTFDMYMNWVMIVGINQEIEPMLIENSSHTQKISAKILIILKYASALASPSHPRQGVPTTVEAFVLCAAVQQPLSFRDGTRLVPRCVPRSINAASIAFPVLQASSAVSTSCLSR